MSLTVNFATSKNAIDAFNFSPFLSVSIDNFNDNIDEYSNNYTFAILDTNQQYNYFGTYSSRICDGEQIFTEKNGKIGFNISFKINNNDIDQYFNPNDTEDIFQIELFFEHSR